MKLAILIGTALLGTAGIAAAPAEAQRYDSGRDRGGYRGWHGDRGGHQYRGDRRHLGPRWRGGYGRQRVVCRVHRGYYGPVRRCVRR